MTRLRTAATRLLVACLVAPIASGLMPARAAGTSPAATGPGVTVTGTLLVAPAERPSDPASYALQTDQGALVEITSTAAIRAAQPGARFSGRLAVPSSLTRASSGSAVLGDAQAQHVRLQVVSASLSAPRSAAAGVSHRWFAAAPSNFGAQGMTDAAILAQLAEVGRYWTSQANGAITGITTPTAVTRYASSATTTSRGCGLTGSDFWPVVQEAAARFPTADFAGSDQLLVLMPTTCATGVVTGRGTQGLLSFGTGGYSISVTNSQWFQPTVAHEIGHNYGYGHARLGPCSPTCSSEYGDLYSVMGAAVLGYLPPTALSTAYRVMQGITDSGEVETLSTSGTKSFTRTIRARSATSGLRALAVPNPSTGQTLYLDYRSGTGADASAFYAQSGSPAYRRGVVVEGAHLTSGIALVPDASRLAMVVGESRTFAGGDVTVTVTAMTADTATVKVELKGLPAYKKPGTVALSAAPKVGTAISAVLKGWTPAPASVGYQWYADGVPVKDATAASLTPTPGMAGAALSVTAVATAAGYAPATVASPPKAVAMGTFSLSTKASLSGTPSVGSSLACAAPTLRDAPASLIMLTRWLSNGTPIAGATRSDLVVTSDLLGATLTCEVTITSDGFQPLTATSARSGRVAPGRLRTGEVGLSGEAKVGKWLTATSGTWTIGTTFSYQWYIAPNKPISGETASQLAVTGSLRGKKVYVAVTGQLAGYTTTTVKSLSTASVS